MPALLPENFFVLIDVGIKDRVQIYIHQILEIPVVAAGHRIHRFIRISHGVQEGIERPLRQLHKRILQGKFPGTAEHGVLDDMGHAGRVLRRCPKGDGKHFVFIFVGEHSDSGSCFFMAQQIPLCPHIPDFFPAQQFVCVQHCFFSFFCCSGRRFRPGHKPAVRWKEQQGCPYNHGQPSCIYA